jgi:hypothetical protein
VLADIPGLIEGAHEGAGLGDRFLGHVERCRVLLHLVDATCEHAGKAYKTVRTELDAYEGNLADKIEIVALNKIDAVTPEELKDAEGPAEARRQEDAAAGVERVRRRRQGRAAGAGRGDRRSSGVGQSQRRRPGRAVVAGDAAGLSPALRWFRPAAKLRQTVIASSVPTLGPTLMNETNTTVIARLDRATQYSRDASDRIEKPRCTGSPGQAGRRQFCCGGRLT